MPVPDELRNFLSQSCQQDPYGHNAASSIDEVYNSEPRKNLVWNTRVSQKTTQPCFHIGLGSWGAEPPRYFEWGLDKFRLKRAWNYPYLAHQIQNFLRQGSACNPQKSYTYVWLLTEKGLKLWNYGSPKYTFSYEKEGAPLWPPKITYFCNFRKNALKLGIFSSQNTKFS